jgi:hypothetical protein
MSKFIVALTLPEFGSTPNSPTSGFYKYYLRSNWLKVLNSAGLQRDVVLDRPLDGFVADNPPCLPITATDTVLTAFEKFQCIMDNLAIITGSLKAATPWTAEHTTTNNDQYQIGTIVYYMNSVYKCIAANDSIIPTNATYWQYLGVASGFYTQEQADWDATTGSSFIRNKPTIPPTPIQPDWDQTDTGALDFIKNKPTDFGFDPLGCNAKIITNQLDSCNATLEIQKDAAYQVKLQGQNIGKGPGLIDSNTVHGYQALNANTTGSNSVAVGYQSLKANTIGDNNTAVGNNALIKATAYENTAIGSLAGYNVTTGYYNIAIGADALNAYTGTVACTGNSNIAIGKYALAQNVSGINNIVVGVNSSRNVSSGSGNISIGVASLYNNTSGSFNTIVGDAAGYILTGSNNVFIGYSAGAWQTAVSNKIIFDTRDRGSAVNEDAKAPLIIQSAINADDQTVTINAFINLKPISQPSSPIAGTIYYDSGVNKLRCYDGTSWYDLF